MDQDLFFNSIEIIIAVIILLFFGAIISVILRRPILEGIATGLLFAASSCGVAFYISFEFALPLWIFIVLSFFLLSLIILGMRKFIFKTPFQGRVASYNTWTIVLSVSILICFVRLLTPFPQAGYSIFQAWNPLYLVSSVQEGRFLTISDMTFGMGFLGSHILYPTDTFSLAALLHLTTGLSPQACILAASISTVIAAFSILSFGLRRSPLALIGYSLLFLFFLRYGIFFRTPLTDNIVDNLTYLAGAAAIYYISSGEAGRVARIGSSIVLASAVMSRPSGAVYSAFFAINGLIADLKKRTLRQNFMAWVFFSVILGILSFREVILLWQGGIFGARPQVLEIYAPSLSKSFWGILTDLGIIAHPGIFSFSLPMLSFSVVTFAVVIFLKREKIALRPRIIGIYLAPTLILLAPVLVEIITGFRKHEYGSKLYYISIFFYSWYPWWLVSRFKLMQWWPKYVNAFFKYSSIIGLSILLILSKLNFDYFFERYTWAVSTYRANETDGLMAKAIKQNTSNEKLVGEIIAAPIIYFYYEPGIGLRYYLGGNFFTDYDFWGDSFQKLMQNADNFEDVLKKLDYPNIYISYRGGIEGGSKWTYSESWKKFESEIRNLTNAPYVKKIIRSGDALFFVTGPTFLKQSQK